MVRRRLAVDLTGGLDDAWSEVVAFVPRLAVFLVVLVVGWVVARTAAKVLERMLRRAGSERPAARSGVRLLLRDSPHDLTGIISRLVFYLLMLAVLRLALGVFGPNPVGAVVDGVVAWLPRGIVAVLLVVVTLAVADAVRRVVGSVLASAAYGGAVARVLWAVVLLLGFVAAASQAGVATGVVLPVLYAGLATVGGIAVVGVGGGLIGPMRSRWERWLTRAEQEVAAARSGVAAYRAEREGEGDGTGRPEGERHPREG
ncbi:mechanosensitive ion channel family protein [Streptomyces fragilis]|uniref:Integral membrane protein n=1 Tax=Streptomyces fragilis TaxID=67301 RepID=A0ABV2YFW6_9ACTN|nr:hypothetical protein [Streptomyces fragilis]